MRRILRWGAHAHSRAADDALVIALAYLKVRFGEGAETSTRSAWAPRIIADALVIALELSNPQSTLRNPQSVVCGQWSVVSGRWSAVSGRWSAVSGRWSAVSGRWSAVGGTR